MSDRVNEKAWQDLETDMENPQPTPPVGESVVWYMAGDTRKPVPALVTGIEGSGRLKLVTFQVNSFPAHKTGVYHVSAKIHDKPGNFQTKNCGSWDYVRKPIPEEDYAAFNEEIEKRRANLAVGEESAKRQAQIFAEKQGLLKTKKKLSDPLPAPA